MKRLFVVPLMVAAVLASANPVPSLAAHSCKAMCNTCAASCEAGAKHIEKKKGDKALIKALRDCVKACKDYAGSGDKAKEEACRTACSSCAEACEKSGDAALKQCIADCKTCAESCSK